jgi:formyltetrahydrofolate synthetase
LETAGFWRECRTLPLMPTVSGVPTLQALAAIASCRAGDRHAITTARKLLAALIGSRMFYGNELDLDPDAITWPRTLDMNDRALRTITVSVTGPDKKLRDVSNRSSGFLITAASEVMAILALASSREDAPFKSMTG